MECFPSAQATDRVQSGWRRRVSGIVAPAITQAAPERLMEPLKPRHRRRVELRLQGHLIDEIAAETGRSERLMRRVLDQVKRELGRRRHDGSAA
jgi:hypothetical protein